MLSVSPPCCLFPPCGSCSLGEAARSGGKGHLRPPPASWFGLKVAGFSERPFFRAGALSWLRRRKEGAGGRKEKHEGRLDEGNGAGERDGGCGSPSAEPRTSRPDFAAPASPCPSTVGSGFWEMSTARSGEALGVAAVPESCCLGEKWWLQAASRHRHGCPAFPTGLRFLFYSLRSLQEAFLAALLLRPPVGYWGITPRGTQTSIKWFVCQPLTAGLCAPALRPWDPRGGTGKTLREPRVPHLHLNTSHEETPRPESPGEEEPGAGFGEVRAAQSSPGSRGEAAPWVGSRSLGKALEEKLKKNTNA